MNHNTKRGDLVFKAAGNPKSGVKFEENPNGRTILFTKPDKDSYDGKRMDGYLLDEFGYDFGIDPYRTSGLSLTLKKLKYYLDWYDSLKDKDTDIARWIKTNIQRYCQLNAKF